MKGKSILHIHNFEADHTYCGLKMFDGDRLLLKNYPRRVTTPPTHKGSWLHHQTPEQVLPELLRNRGYCYLCPKCWAYVLHDYTISRLEGI